MSRVFNVLNVINPPEPNNVHISSIRINSAQPIVEVLGNTKRRLSVAGNLQENDFKHQGFKIGEEKKPRIILKKIVKKNSENTEGGEVRSVLLTENIEAGPDSVLVNDANSEMSLSFSFSFTYAEELFLNTSAGLCGIDKKSMVGLSISGECQKELV